MEIGLGGRVALVTGAGSGIGRATALTFAEEGVRVAVVDLDQVSGARVAQEVRDRGGEAEFVPCDVSQWESAEAAVGATVARFGQLDIVANVAGVWRINRFQDMPRQDWDFEVAVNFYGVLNVTRAALDQMVPRRAGAIVSVGSDAGRAGEPNQAVYSGVKAGVIGFSKGLAKDVGRHGIRVNVVCPSRTVHGAQEQAETELRARGNEEEIRAFEQQQARALRLYPLRKFGKPQDVANMIVFLASDRAGHVTGQTVSVNGGYIMP